MHSLIILVGVSGTGKTTLEKYLVTNHNFNNSVSWTTRNIRPGEKNGIDYYFKTTQEFEEAIKNGQILEWDKAFENYYGTEKQQLLTKLETQNVVLSLTLPGFRKLKKELKNKVHGFYLLPPKKEDLIARMSDRDLPKQELELRLKNIEKQVKQESQYLDHIIQPTTTEKTAKIILATISKT